MKNIIEEDHKELNDKLSQSKRLEYRDSKPISSAFNMFKNIPKLICNNITVKSLNKNGIKVSSIDDLFSKLYIDKMTGAYNQDYLNYLLSKEMLEADKTNRTVCIAYLDGDNVKYVNDNYSHAICDKEIILLVNNIANKFADSKDNINIAKPCENVRFIRAGGDEFLVISYDAHPTYVIENIKQVHLAIQEDGLMRRINALDTSKIKKTDLFPCPPIYFTSVVTERIKGETIKEMIERLDKILNKAKLLDRGSIYYDNTQIYTKNFASNEKISNVKEVVERNKAKDKYFVVCDFEYLDSSVDRRGQINSHTKDSISNIDLLIKKEFGKCLFSYIMDEHKLVMILESCSFEDFTALKDLINRIIKLDNELNGKILFSIGGQEMLEKYTFDQIIRSAEIKLNSAKSSGKDVIIDRRLMA